jgi:hypothetical protein
MRQAEGVRSRRRILGVLAVVLLAASSCGGGSPRTSPTTPSTVPGNSTSTPSTTTRTVEPLTARAAVSPDQGPAGTTVFTFTVTIRGPGTLSGEEVQFGDGQTSGANAGMITCGETARADRISTYTHTYAQPGTYTFTDDVNVLGPPPACTPNQARAVLTLVVGAPLPSATLNGAFLSPTRNIACSIEVTQTNSVRCATFVPPSLVTMDTTGSFRTCTGRTCQLGNPAPETPVLAYGSATAAGPFQCLSTPSGMTCTVVGHKGFTISRSGITAVR